MTTRVLTVAEGVKLFVQEGMQPYPGAHFNVVDGKATACLIGALALHEGASFRESPSTVRTRLRELGFSQDYQCGAQAGFDRVGVTGNFSLPQPLSERRRLSADYRLGYVLGWRVARRLFGYGSLRS